MQENHLTKKFVQEQAVHMALSKRRELTRGNEIVEATKWFTNFFHNTAGLLQKSSIFFLFFDGIILQLEKGFSSHNANCCSFFILLPGYCAKSESDFSRVKSFANIFKKFFPSGLNGSEAEMLL